MSSSAELTRVVINLPNELGGALVYLVVREASDLDQSWAKLVKKRHHWLYEQLFPRSGRRHHYVIKDNRPPPYRKQWELETGLISDFINSFRSVLAAYHATIVLEDSFEYGKSESPKRVRFTMPGEREPIKVSSSPSPGVQRKYSNLSRAQELSSAARPSREASNSTRARKPIESGAPRNALVRNPFWKPSFLSRGRGQSKDNSVDSLDSSDVPEDGMEIQDVKASAVQNLQRRVDNETVLKVVKELKDLKDNGNWLRIASSVPLTAHLVQELFPSINQ
ncbi:unnamed protein product [Orchesella dallaii]|uniref:PX domain-containing protein n=1 Tax=Orchesella dallaii TaxID=48710 RepID=A0ABP1RI71_9HEXA